MGYGFGRINDMVHDVHENARVKGFHDDLPKDPEGYPLSLFEVAPRHLLSLLMLVVTEAAEAAEAVREDNIKNFEEELADICIRVFDIAGACDLNLEQAIVNKMTKNSNRQHMHGGKRA